MKYIRPINSLRHVVLMVSFLGTLGFAVYAPFNLHAPIRPWQWAIISPLLFIAAAYGWNKHILELKQQYCDHCKLKQDDK